MDSDIIAFRFDPVALFRFEEKDAPVGFDNDPLQVFWFVLDFFQQGENSLIRIASAVALNLKPGALQSFVKPFAIKGLQQVIKRVDFKCPQRVFVVSSDKNNAR